MAGVNQVMADALRFAQVINTYTITGAGTEIVPYGAKHVKIQGEGGGGSGGMSGAGGTGGDGGGGGAFFEKDVDIVPADWGKSLAYVVGNGGARRNAVNAGIAGSATTVTINALASAPTNLSAGGGQGGSQGGGGSSTGGTATGGDTNTSGGTATTIVGAAGAAGFGGSTSGRGTDGALYGGGGGGAKDTVDAHSGGGADGKLVFTWT
jgi:hypothetical protein